MAAAIHDADDGSDRMIFVEPCGPMQRILFAAFGLMTFLAPWELLVRPGHPFELGSLPFWFISLGALSIGFPLLAGAALGLRRTLVIDFDARRFDESGRGSFGLRLHRSCRFDELAELAVVEDTWSDGPSQWRLEARFTTAPRPWPIRTSSTQTAAQTLADEIRARMSRSA